MKTLIVNSVITTTIKTPDFEQGDPPVICKYCTPVQIDIHSGEKGIITNKNGQHTDEGIFFKEKGIIRRLKIKDIEYVEAMGDYVKLYTLKKMYIVHSTLKAVEQRLPEYNFVRIHRSFIIALDKLDSIQDGSVIIRDRFIPIADNWKKSLFKRMNIL